MHAQARKEQHRMQQEQREEWIRRHTWGATMIDQDKQWETPQEDGQGTVGTMGDLPENEETPLGTHLPPSPTPHIVEGTLVESTVLVPSPPLPSSAQAERDHHPAQSLRRWVQQSLVTVLVALCTLLLLTPIQPRVMRLFVTLVPAAGSSATVTVVTDQVDLHRSYTLLAEPAGMGVPVMSHQKPPQAQLQARLLAAPALAQTITVPTTGKGHQPAAQAHGLVTFYNQAPNAQTIPSGMLLTGADGMQVVTAYEVVVPAAHLPLQGQVTVAAHAVESGPQGNIEANDLNGLCCFTGIAMQNTQAFVGGANARDFPAVGSRDVSGATNPLVTSLTRQGQAVVQAQVRTHEQLVHPVKCDPQVTSAPVVGEEATQVTVTAWVTCHAEVYNADEVQAKVSVLIGQEATTRLSTGYVLQGEVTANLSTIATFDAQHGIIALYVQVEGVWAYHMSAAQLHALATLVAGKPLGQAQTILLHAQGIHQVSIASTDWWDDTTHQTLPPTRIGSV